jgi:hypothetical protein
LHLSGKTTDESLGSYVLVNNSCPFISALRTTRRLFMHPPLSILRLISSHHLSSTSSIIGGTAYGQNITTATTGKYLKHNHISLSSLLPPLHFLSSHHSSLCHSSPFPHPTREGKDSHHSTPTHFLPLRRPSRPGTRTRTSTRARAAHGSVCPKFLDSRSLDPRSCECREHWAASERRHRFRVEIVGLGFLWCSALKEA